jgi:osmoprotectant transport system substrate-binding protein
MTDVDAPGRFGRGHGGRPLVLALVVVLAVVAVGVVGVVGAFRRDGSAPPVLTLGSGETAPEQLFANLYAGALRAQHIDVRIKVVAGGAGAQLAALRSGQIDLIPAYTGDALTALASTGPAASTAAQRRPADVQRELATRLAQQGLSLSNASPGQFGEAVVVTASTAKRYQLTRVSDLRRVAATMTFGQTPTFQRRSGGVAALQHASAARFEKVTPLADSDAAAIAALTKGTVGATAVFAAAPAIVGDGLVTLTDSASAFVAQNVAVIARDGRLSPAAIRASKAVTANLTTVVGSSLLARVSDVHDPDRVAATWLASIGLASTGS